MTYFNRAWERVFIVLLTLVLVFSSLSIAAFIRAERGCQEDEVLAVQLDQNPQHGLTWRCENVGDFIERTVAEKGFPQ